MSENLNLKTISTIDPSPFKHLCVTIGELPSTFLESMSYYEMLAWFVNYLENTVIPAVNANGEATAELQELFVQLKTYVDTYFDNLDVQEEINNKLDAMVEDGTFRQLLADTVQFVTYEMFGAALDGTSDDTEAVIAAHNYANEHHLPVIQKRGVVYMPTASINNCPIVNTDCDLTGCTFKYDANNDNDTVMIVADPLTLSSNKREVQSTDLSSSQISALSPDNANPITFLNDYKDHYVVFETDMDMGKRIHGYLENIYYAQGFEVNKDSILTPNNMYADISSNATSVSMKYLPLTQQHLNIRFPKILIDGNTNNNPKISIMRNNVKISDGVIEKTNYNNTTAWYQPLIEFKYCANVTMEHFTGECASSEPVGENIISYIAAFSKCYNVNFSNNNLIRLHTSFITYHCNFMNVNNNVMNILDNHYGLFGNVNFVNNTLTGRGGSINLGYGNGQVNIDNCGFYKYAENGLWTRTSCVFCRTDLTVMYAGIININNCYVEATNSDNTERYATLFSWFPDSNENSTYPTFGNYDVPIVNTKNINYKTNNMLIRTAEIGNNNYANKKYNLRQLDLSSNSYQNVSYLDFRDVNTTNKSSIILNNENIRLHVGSNAITVYLKENCKLRSDSDNTLVDAFIDGGNNIVRGTYKSITNNGEVSVDTSVIVETLNNFGKLNTKTYPLTTTDIYSTGYLNCEDTLTVTNGTISGYFRTKNLVNVFAENTDLMLVGAQVNIYGTITNNQSIGLSGCFMYSGSAGRFNNGTIRGNGNWGGDNSNLINTLT